jgi:hypothetical protein
VADERQQLAAIGTVITRLDRTLDDLFASVAELKTNLGLQAEVAPVTAPEPPPPPEPGGALTAIQGLQAAIETMSGDLRTVSSRLASAEKRERRLRHIMTGLAISFALDLLITAGLGWNTVRQNDIQNANQADQIAACRVANVSRIQDAAVWDTLLADLAPPKAQTPRVKALLRGIEKRIEAKDRPHNCAAQYKH